MDFLREHFNTKHKKLKANYSVSKAKTCNVLAKTF